MCFDTKHYLLCLLILLLLSVVQLLRAESDITITREQLMSWQTRMQDLKRQLLNLQENLKTADSSIVSLQAKLKLLSIETDNLKVQLTEYQTSIQTLQSLQIGLEKSLMIAESEANELTQQSTQLLQKLTLSSAVNKQFELYLKIFIPSGIVLGLALGVGITSLIVYGLSRIGVIKMTL